MWPPGVPTFVLDGRVRVGFDGDGDGPRDLQRGWTRPSHRHRRRGFLPIALAAAAALALLVNLVELLCTAGLPAPYTAVLSQQGRPASGYYGYLMLYIAAYLVDDALMVGIAVAALSSRRLEANTGRWLKLVSGLVRLGLALLMLLRPQWLV